MAKIVILKATNREAVCTIVSVHVGITAVKVEVACVSTTYRTRPIVAVGTYIVKRAITVVAVTS